MRIEVTITDDSRARGDGFAFDTALDKIRRALDQMRVTHPKGKGSKLVISLEAIPKGKKP